MLELKDALSLYVSFLPFRCSFSLPYLLSLLWQTNSETTNFAASASALCASPPLPCFRADEFHGLRISSVRLRTRHLPIGILPFDPKPKETNTLCAFSDPS